MTEPVLGGGHVQGSHRPAYRTDGRGELADGLPAGRDLEPNGDRVTPRWRSSSRRRPCHRRGDRVRLGHVAGLAALRRAGMGAQRRRCRPRLSASACPRDPHPADFDGAVDDTVASFTALLGVGSPGLGFPGRAGRSATLSRTAPQMISPAQPRRTAIPAMRSPTSAERNDPPPSTTSTLPPGPDAQPRRLEQGVVFEALQRHSRAGEPETSDRGNCGTGPGIEARSSP